MKMNILKQAGEISLVILMEFVVKKIIILPSDIQKVTYQRSLIEKLLFCYISIIINY
jgi:hypothetical protein